MADSPASAGPWGRLRPRGVEWIPALLIAASLVPRIAVWFRRDYNHDDFAFGWASWAYALGRGGWGYGYIFPLQEFLKGLFVLFPESFFPLDFARVLVLLFYLANLTLVFWICRRLGASRAWCLAACAVAAWQPDLVLRAEDIRTDAFGAACILGGALLLLRAGERFKPEHAGLLFGVAVVFDYKFGVVAPFAAAAVFLLTWPRSVVALARLLGGAVVPVALYLGRLVVRQSWKVFWGGLELTALSLKTGGEGKAGVPQASIFRHSPLTFLILAVGALGLSLLLSSRPVSVRRVGVYALLVVSFFALFLRLNPYFFPYNFSLFTPLLATLIPGIPVLLERARSVSRSATLALCLIGLVAVAEGLPAFEKAVTRTNEAQKRVVKWIWKSTSPDEHVFDWQGMHLFRPGIEDWWIFTGLVPRYAEGSWYSVADELQRDRVTLIVSTYRLNWLNLRDMDYVRSHYVWIDSCLLAPGRIFSAEDLALGPVAYDPPVDGDYRVDHAGLSGLRIDENPVTDIVHLTRKTHAVELAKPVSVPKFALVYTTPLRNPADRPCPRNQPLLYGFD
jgi:hypothetical protein